MRHATPAPVPGNGTSSGPIQIEDTPSARVPWLKLVGLTMGLLGALAAAAIFVWNASASYAGKADRVTVDEQLELIRDRVTGIELQVAGMKRDQQDLIRIFKPEWKPRTERSERSD